MNCTQHLPKAVTYAIERCGFAPVSTVQIWLNTSMSFGERRWHESFSSGKEEEAVWKESIELKTQLFRLNVWERRGHKSLFFIQLKEKEINCWTQLFFNSVHCIVHLELRKSDLSRSICSTSSILYSLGWRTFLVWTKPTLFKMWMTFLTGTNSCWYLDYKGFQADNLE